MLLDTRSPGESSRSQLWFETTRPELAIAFVESLYGPHRLRLVPKGAMDLRVCGFDVGRLNFGTVRYGCSAVAEVVDDRDMWVFSRVLNGTTSVGDERAKPGDAGVLAPRSARLIPMSEDFELINMRVSIDDLDAACASLLGSDLDAPLEFPERMPAGSVATLAFDGLLKRLSATPSYTHPNALAMERHLQEAALFELLMTWPHPYTKHLAEPRALPRSTRLARDYIHAHLDEVISLGDIARAAGVGVRALTRGFEKSLGTSPMRYLTNCRLERVHAQLSTGRADIRITDVALRMGFTNLGDFAAAYRRRYGSLPSQTLKNRHVVPVLKAAAGGQLTA